MNVKLVSLGCARTLVDSEVALGFLKADGWGIVSDLRKADVAVVNTCGFIEEAKRESIEAILELCQLKKKGRLSAVVVLGCLAQRYPEELRKELKEVDGIIGTDSYDRLPALLAGLEGRRRRILDVRAKPRYLADENTPRERLTPGHYAYLKISEGCINACTYCVIPQMKGAHRSRTVESIVEEARRLAASNPGLAEILLIGQDTAAFGFDRGRRFELARLLRELDALGAAPWLRLLYAHPGHLDEEMIDAMAEARTVCKYVDYPIEHSHDRMLARMNRAVTRERMQWGIRRLRERMPGVAIRTTVIVGFPGEIQEEFDDLLDFLWEARFDRLGAFKFSREEGSRAYGLPDQIDDSLKQERFEAVMRLQEEVVEERNRRLVGTEVNVLVDGPASGRPGVFAGRTEADAPEVDGGVLISSERPLRAGSFVRVKVDGHEGHDLLGRPSSGAGV